MEMPLLDERNWTNNETEVQDAVFQHYYQRQIFAAFAVITAILGVAGNSLVILAVMSSKKLQKTTNVFVVNLAVADVLSCLFLPWQAVSVLGEDSWPIPNARWLCAMAAFVLIITLGCSINSLMLIAINRWMIITKSPLIINRLYTPCKLAIMVICSWGIPLCAALTVMLTDFGDLGYNKVLSSCSWNESDFNRIIIIVFNYPIQLCLIIMCYTSILHYVRKTSRKVVDVQFISTNVDGEGIQNIRRQLRKRQLAVTKNLVYIILAFILCTTPYVIFSIIQTDWGKLMVQRCGILLFFNSCINPIIYAISHQDFKEAFAHMIRCRKNPKRGLMIQLNSKV